MVGEQHQAAVAVAFDNLERGEQCGTRHVLQGLSSCGSIGSRDAVVWPILSDEFSIGCRGAPHKRI